MDRILVRVNVDGEIHIVALLRARISDLDDLMRKLKERKILVVLVKDAFSPYSIITAAAYTLTDIRRSTGIAKDPVMQFALNLTGTHQLSKALDMIYPQGDVAYLVGIDNAFEELSGLYQPLELNGVPFDDHVVDMFSARANGINWKYKKSNQDAT